MNVRDTLSTVWEFISAPFSNKSNMTPAQLTTFKAAILADANLTALRSANEHGQIAAYYNAAGTGSIWRPSISISELNTAIVWSEFASLSTALQVTYQVIVATGTVDATSANIRAGFSTVFAGKTSLTNLTAIAARTPTVLESLFTTANVCSVFGQQVSAADVAKAMAS